MNNKKIIMPVLTFIAGLILGVAVMYLFYDFSGTDNMGNLPPVQKIQFQDARAARDCYMKQPYRADSLKGFAVNLEQLHAMMLLYQNNPRLTGFRFYFGVVGDPVDVTVVCGMNKTSDITSEIFETTRDGSGPCPDFCDDGSEVPVSGD